MAGGFQHRSMNKHSTYASAEYRDGYQSPPKTRPIKRKNPTFAEVMADAGYELESKRAKPNPEEYNKSRSANDNALFVYKHKVKARAYNPEQHLLVNQHLPQTLHKIKVKPGVRADIYNPEQPLLIGQPLKYLQEIKVKSVVEARQAERAATPSYTHNPHLVLHLVSGARYTHISCRNCTRERKCREHRAQSQPRTTISLCKHTYMILTWGIDDPANEKGSWKLEIRDYGMDVDIARWEHANDCKAYRPSERVKVLAKRFVDDLGNERITRSATPLRGSVARAEREIRTLISAWERTQMIKRCKQEEKWVAEERKKKTKREAEEKLAETLRKIREMEDEKKRKECARTKAETKETVTKLEDEIVAGEVSPTSRSAANTSGATGPCIETETPEPTTPKTPEMASFENSTASPTTAKTPELPPFEPSPASPDVSEPATPKSPTPLSPLSSTFDSESIVPDASACNKRKRSIDSDSVDPSLSSVKKVKKVRFAYEIEVWYPTCSSQG
jgi:hypothetical protein